MAGETSLRTLLRTLTPELNPGDYVFCTNAGRPNAWACPTNTWRPGSP